MVDGLGLGIGLGVFAVGVQILALLAVYGAGPGKEARVYALAFVLGACVMVGMGMLYPLALVRWQIDGLAVMAMCG